MKKIFFFLLLSNFLLMFTSCISEDVEYGHVIPDNLTEESYLLFIEYLLESGGAFDFAEQHRHQWTKDVLQLRAAVFAYHPKFNSGWHQQFANHDTNAQIAVDFNRHLLDLAELAPNLTLEEIKIQLQKGVALLRNGHFNWYIDPSRDETFLMSLVEEQFPLNFRYFSDGFYLIESHPNYDHMLNSRLIAIQGEPVEKLLEEFILFWNTENIYSARTIFAQVIHVPKIINILLGTNSYEIIYTFESLAGEIENISQSQTFAGRDGLLVSDTTSDDLPMFLQNSYEYSWYYFLEDEGILFIRINRFLGPSLAFELALRDILNTNYVSAVIVDVRDNMGGIIDLHRRIFSYLINNDFELFYFINERSLSASLINGATFKNGGAIIIGQPSGQNTSFYTVGLGTQDIDLNYLGFRFSIPIIPITLEGTHGIVSRDGIFRPHYTVEYTIYHWKNGIDPYLDFVKNY